MTRLASNLAFLVVRVLTTDKCVDFFSMVLRFGRFSLELRLIFFLLLQISDLDPWIIFETITQSEKYNFAGIVAREWLHLAAIVSNSRSAHSTENKLLKIRTTLMDVIKVNKSNRVLSVDDFFNNCCLLILPSTSWKIVCFSFVISYLKEETQNFASEMFSSGFFVIHDTSAGSQHNVSAKNRNKKTRISTRFSLEKWMKMIEVML